MVADALRGARIAVTGASGFVGGRVVRALVARGASVHGFGRRAEHPLAGASYTSWDIAQGPLGSAPEVDAVVHCAGMVTDWGPRSLFLGCHVDGTRHVLASFPEPCAVVHVSTASVYDPIAGACPLREDAPSAKRWLNGYSETKAMAERIALARQRTVVLRPHAIYGPGDKVLLPRILEAYRGGRLIAAGDGTNRVSLTHVDNLVDAVVLAVQALLGSDVRGVFNVADDEPVTMDGALRAVLVATGREPRILYLPYALAYGLGATLEAVCGALGTARAPRLTRYRVAQIAHEYTLELTRAKELLGYAPTRSLSGFIEGGGLSATSSRP